MRRLADYTLGVPHNEQNSYGRDTIFYSVYGTKFIIPMEIGVSSFRTLSFDEKNNETELRLNFDLLDEKRERAEIRHTTYKHQVAKYYNQRVKHISFLPGDFVLRKVNLSTKL